MTESPDIMRFKARIRNYAKEQTIPPQTAMQNFMFERFLLRLSRSRFRDKFAIKGGVLISAIVGASKRTTMDIDATLRNMTLDERSLADAIGEICVIDCQDNISFRISALAPIRKDDAYGGLRVSMIAEMETTRTPFSIDVSTGDSITPQPVVFDFHSSFDDSAFPLLAYTIETVLAEKIEAIFTLGVFSTRPRDYYDIKILSEKCAPDKALFSKALVATSMHRGTINQVLDWKKSIEVLSKDAGLHLQWEKYRRRFSFAQDVDFQSCIAAIRGLMDATDLPANERSDAQPEDYGV